MTTLAYHGDQSLKADLVAGIKEHRNADQLIRGDYGNGFAEAFRGCSVGCAIRTLRQRRGLKAGFGDHAKLAEFTGIPHTIWRLNDSIFERLPEGHKEWPLRFAEAVPVGADLDMVWPQLALWLLRDAGFLRVTDGNRDAINGVIALYAEWVESGVKPDQERWRAAAAADADAAAYAAAAADAAAYAAYAAADAAYAADADAAAYAAADAAAAADADGRAWTAMADKLVELVSAAPVLQTR